MVYEFQWSSVIIYNFPSKCEKSVFHCSFFFQNDSLDGYDEIILFIHHSYRIIAFIIIVLKC